MPEVVGGADKPLAIMNGTIAAAAIMATGFVLYIPFAIIVHVFLRWLTKQDPYLRLVYRRYNRQADRYEPWPRATAKPGARPDGFGRGLPC